MHLQNKDLQMKAIEAAVHADSCPDLFLCCIK